MEVLKGALLTKDRDYADALCKCIRNIQPALNISIVDSVEEALDYDMLISDEIDVKVEKIPVCVLSSRDDQDEKRIYKYSNVSSMVNRIIEIYENETGVYVNQFLDNGKSLIYTVSATCGGLGASSVAYAMAKDYALAGKYKVLYISLCETYQECQFFKSNKGLNVVDMLHKILFSNKKIQVNRYILQDDYGVNYFNFFGITNHLESLKSSEFIRFIGVILQSSSFDKIIVDVGNSLFENANYMRKISNVNILLRNSDLCIYENEIIKNMDIDMEKVVSVENKRYRGNPKFDEFFEAEDQLKELIDIGISMDTFAFVNRDGIRDIEIDGEFGKDIRELINYIE